MFEIYGRQDCPYCDMAKEVLSDRKLPFTYYELKKDITVEEFRTKFPDQRTVPVVLVRGVKIGGYTELVEYLEDTSGGFGDG
jgi:glutaredoxin